MTRRKRWEKACWAAALVSSLWSLSYLVAAHTPPPAAPLRSQAVGPAASGSRLGTLVIPAIGLSVPIVEDDDTQSLLHGLGHIRGTAMLGGLGTTALAGHRDTFLRPIRHVAPSMEIRAVSPAGVFHYIVDSTEIVDPGAVQVLDIRDRPELVLVTCYPFDYIGAAPKRFIVHAHLVSAAPAKDGTSGGD